MSNFFEQKVLNNTSVAPKTFLTLCFALFVLGLMLSLTGCQKDFSGSSPEKKELQNEELSANSNAMQNNSNAMSVTEITFTATAMIAYCHGENIRFTGIIENRVKTTINANGGNHYTRHFTVKGMTGIGVTNTGAPTGTQYNVIGGAEMFSIKDALFNPDGSLNLSGTLNSLTEGDIVIHRGTLVFEKVGDGSRVIARHDIQKVPGKGILQNRWLCAGNRG
jgi:hypothetical protein